MHLSVSIDIASVYGALAQVYYEMQPHQIAVLTGLIGHPLELPHVACKIPVRRLLDLHNKKILLLPNSMHNEVGNDCALPDQLLFRCTVTKPFDDVLSTAPFDADRPTRKLSLKQDRLACNDGALCRIGI